MRRTGWQSKNLPRGGSWLPTFLSPLYVYYVHNISDPRAVEEEKRKIQVSQKYRQLLPLHLNYPAEEMISNAMFNLCNHCKKHKADLKQCVRCKIALYCDANCQKADWRKHKVTCIKV